MLISPRSVLCERDQTVSGYTVGRQCKEDKNLFENSSNRFKNDLLRCNYFHLWDVWTDWTEVRNKHLKVEEKKKSCISHVCCYYLTVWILQVHQYLSVSSGGFYHEFCVNSLRFIDHAWPIFGNILCFYVAQVLYNVLYVPQCLHKYFQ